MKVDLKTNFRQLKIAGHSPHGGFNLITGSGQEVTPVVVKSRRAGKNLKDVYSQEKSRRKMQFPPADNRGIFNADQSTARLAQPKSSVELPEWLKHD